MRLFILFLSLWCISFNSLSDAFSIEINGSEFTDGDTLYINLSPGKEGGFSNWEVIEDEYTNCYTDFYITLKNESGKRLKTSINRLTESQAEGHSLQWCIDNCYFSDLTTFPVTFTNNFQISMHCIFAIESTDSTGESRWIFTIGEGKVNTSDPSNPVAEIVDNESKKSIVIHISYSDPAEIRDITSEAEASYYNLQGMPIAYPQKGSLYIEKRGNKSFKKIIR